MCIIEREIEVVSERVCVYEVVKAEMWHLTHSQCYSPNDKFPSDILYLENKDKYKHKYVFACMYVWIMFTRAFVVVCLFGYDCVYVYIIVLVCRPMRILFCLFAFFGGGKFCLCIYCMYTVYLYWREHKRARVKTLGARGFTPPSVKVSPRIYLWPAAEGKM